MRRWDIFCTVVDNYGDIGTCWRLARLLADEHSIDVRLWIDRLDSLQSLYPAISADADTQHVGRVEIRRWRADFSSVDPADVVIEAFACELPETYVTAMAMRAVPPVWINLEYLSAESWVDDCHRLPSPHQKLRLTKHFFFPGFTPKTGGLMRERKLFTEPGDDEPAAAAEFLRSCGIDPTSADELLVSLFCYENPALPGLLTCWANGPGRVRLLATPGAAARQIEEWFGESFVNGSPLRRANLTVEALPFFPQTEYDRLLCACDVNFVRGEDSFVRAQWARQPFVWQIYSQDENAHLVKLEAFLTRYLDQCPAGDAVRRFWMCWNGTGVNDGEIAAAWRNFAANRPQIQRYGKDWVCQLDRAGELANNLVCFARDK